ncbi:MFS transporter [Catenulispora rubra]|uniref:MFS transporter n=1 Tax=Catenulispora rubra TaxID=280293 RepID=UPI001E55B264|nr:MFS transporter [Catenulispora rubra]
MERSLRSARIATFTYFILCGTLMGTWVVHIPAIEHQVGISHATLGGLLVLLGLGAFAGMQVSGRLADRFGPRVVVPTAGALCGATLVLPGLAREPWTLAAALLVFGFFNGCLDVSMNAHAVHVEKAYGRPVMSAFHAAFSVGGVLAAIIAAGTSGVGMSPAVALAMMGAVGVVVAVLTTRALLPTEPRPLVSLPLAAEDEHPPLPSPFTRRGAGRRIWLLAALALMIMLCEGAANDWSALHMKDVLGAPASTAAFAYGTFAAAMTLGRLLADRISARFGAMAILRYGAAMAAVGITIVALGPWIWAAFAGWALFGLGLSGCVPQLFSAAGHADPSAAGTNVSRVAGLGYVGMLAGPAVIGWMTHVMALNHAFLLLTAMCVTAATTAGVLRVGSERAPELALSST